MKEKEKITIAALHRSLRADYHMMLISLVAVVVVFGAIDLIVYFLTSHLEKWVGITLFCLLSLFCLSTIGYLLHDIIGMARTLSRGDYVVLKDELLEVKHVRQRFPGSVSINVVYRFRGCGDRIVSTRSYENSIDAALSELHYNKGSGGLSQSDPFRYHPELLADAAAPGEIFYIVFLRHRRKRPIHFFNARHFKMEHGLNVISMLDSAENASE